MNRLELLDEFCTATLYHENEGNLTISDMFHKLNFRYSWLLTQQRMEIENLCLQVQILQEIDINFRPWHLDNNNLVLIASKVSRLTTQLRECLDEIAELLEKYGRPGVEIDW